MLRRLALGLIAYDLARTAAFTRAALREPWLILGAILAVCAVLAAGGGFMRLADDWRIAAALGVIVGAGLALRFLHDLDQERLRGPLGFACAEPGAATLWLAARWTLIMAAGLAACAFKPVLTPVLLCGLCGGWLAAAGAKRCLKPGPTRVGAWRRKLGRVAFIVLLAGVTGLAARRLLEQGQDTPAMAAVFLAGAGAGLAFLNRDDRLLAILARSRLALAALLRRDMVSPFVAGVAGAAGACGIAAWARPEIWLCGLAGAVLAALLAAARTLNVIGRSTVTGETRLAADFAVSLLLAVTAPPLAVPWLAWRTWRLWRTAKILRWSAQ